MRRRCFMAHTPSSAKRLVCCVDQLNPPPKADIVWLSVLGLTEVDLVIRERDLQHRNRASYLYDPHRRNGKAPSVAERGLKAGVYLRDVLKVPNRRSSHSLTDPYRLCISNF